MIGKGLPDGGRDGRQWAREGGFQGARLRDGQQRRSVRGTLTEPPQPFPPRKVVCPMSQVPHPAPSQPIPFTEDDDPTALPHTRIFTALLTDLQRSARRLARSGADADDLVQDTLLRVWSRMAMISDGHKDATPIEDLRAYAFATLRHRAFARYSIARPTEEADEDIVAPRGSDGVTRLACAEALQALEDLPDDQKSLLRLRAMDGLSYADIARKTGLPLGTVTSRLARGRAAMREALDLPPGAPVTDLLGGEPS